MDEFVQTVQQIPLWVDVALDVVPYIGGAAAVGVTLWGIVVVHRIWKDWR